MIGQQKLLDKLNSYSIDTLPKTILLLGESGCGKHTVTKLLAERLNLEIVEINEAVDVATLNEYQHDPVDKLYQIDLSNIQEKQQNKFLKFIEEPSRAMHVVLFAESDITVLETVLNRCFVLTFEQYTTNELKQIKQFTSDFIYSVCRTPGKVLFADEKTINLAKILCTMIVEKLADASRTNTISIYRRINYKEEYDKIDFYLFFSILKQLSFEDYVKTSNERSLKIYTVTCEYSKSLQFSQLNKENFMINFLSKLHKEVVGCY